MREECGLSQRELAEKAGVTRQTINSIERNRYDPSLELALKLAEFFDCYAEDIFLLNGHKKEFGEENDHET